MTLPEILARVVRRSGELVFREETDSGAGWIDEPRWRWLTDWMAPALSRRPRFLDVGCWTGSGLAWASAMGAATVVGVDLPGPWLEVAKRRVPTATVQPMSSIPELPGSLGAPFDVIFLLETLEHLPRGTEVECLSALRRMLAEGGQLIMSTPRAGVSALLDPAWYLVGHRHYSLRRLRRLLREAGLVVREVRWSGNLAEAIATNLMYVEKHVLRRPPRWYRLAQRWHDTNLRHRPTVTATTVWVRATAAADAWRRDRSA